MWLSVFLCSYVVACVNVSKFAFVFVLYVRVICACCCECFCVVLCAWG